MSTISQTRAAKLTIVAAAAAVSAGVFAAPGAAAATQSDPLKLCNEISGVEVCITRLADNGGLRVSVQNRSGSTIRGAQLRILRDTRDDAVSGVADLPNGWGRTGWIVANNCLHAYGVLKSTSLPKRYSPQIRCK